MTNVFNFSRKNRGNRDRKKKNHAWIISMWPFNQYRVLKIKVTRYIYHKAPDVHIFHIIDEKKQDEKRSRCQSELYKRPPRNRWNSFSVYHHDWNDRTFRHVAANSQKDCYCNHKIRSHFDLFLQFFTVLLSLLLFFFFAQFCVFTVTPSKMKVQASQYRKFRI